MKKVIIAEKPSVARNIADAVGIKKKNKGYMEGDDYIITWVFGHLLQLYDAVDYDVNMKSWKLEKFPFIPQRFKYKVKKDRKGTEDKGARDQLETIRKLIDRDDVDEIISATDWDREGQIIADEIFNHIESRKSIKKPIKRILLNEWTKEEVQKGLRDLKENCQLSSLSDAGFSRQTADWLIGINLTSVATVKYNNSGHKNMLNVGRVLMPTLKIIYDRDKEIERFVSSKYHKLNVQFVTDEGEKFDATYYEMKRNSKDRENGDSLNVAENGEEKYSEKFDDGKYLEDILEKSLNENAVIYKKEVETKRENPPLLFNLSNLQGYITSKHRGFTADNVLKVAQELYEKKLITYPRTASNVLDESVKDKVKKVLEIHRQDREFKDEIKFKDTKRIFDSRKVESHSAIIPTYVKAKGLTDDEKHVYTAVLNRFLAQFMKQSISEETKLWIKVEGVEIVGIFIAKGKIQVEEGFKKVEKIQSKDTLLPIVEEKERAILSAGKVVEVKRKPPKYHTEKTLLRVMETCGKSIGDKDEEESEEMMMSILSGFSIGTPATRAETIKKLKDVGYVVADKKKLKTTELGRMMVEKFPVKELFDLEYTGRLEKTLSDIEKKKFTRSEFIDLITDFTVKSVDNIKRDVVFACDVKVEDSKRVVGICPNCKNPVLENEKSFSCSNWRNGCKFTIWKEDKYIQSFGKKVSREMVKLLLQNGKVGFHGLTSKKGNKFSGYFRYVKDETTDRFKWTLEFIKKS